MTRSPATALRPAIRAPDSEEWHSPFNPWITAIVATLATFMEILDTSIANVALPHIAGNLGADVQESTWVLTSYLVSNAIVLPISAWLSSLIGRKNFYMLCVATFTASSFLCGLAPNLPMLVVFRLLQGLGGGGLQPSTQAILVDTFPARQRGMGMAVYGMTVVVAPIIGPILGGWITDNASWRWIFFINVPVGIVSLLLSSRIITDPPYLPRRRGPDRYRVDVFGLSLLTIGLGCLQIVLDLGQRRDWFEDPMITMLAAASFLALIGLVWWELKHHDPIVDLRLLRERNFGLATATMVVFGFVLFSSLVLLPLFTQTLLGYTATLSGLAISPAGVVLMVLMPLVGWLVSRVDQRWMIVAGTMVIAWSLHMMGATFSLDVDFKTVVLTRMVQGLGLAFMFVPINTMAYAFIARERRNQASSLISLARNIGASVGIAVISTLVARGAQREQSYLVAHATPFAPTYSNQLGGIAQYLGMLNADAYTNTLRAHRILFEELAAQARTLAFTHEFRRLAVGVLVLIPLIFLMKRPREVERGAMAAH